MGGGIGKVVKTARGDEEMMWRMGKSKREKREISLYRQKECGIL